HPHAEHAVGLGVGDDLDEAVGLAVGLGAAVGEHRKLADFDLAVLLRLVLGEADAGNLRHGVDHRRNHIVVPDAGEAGDIPSRRHAEPSSSPMTPPPMATMRLGTCGSSSAPVESTIRSWSMAMPGSGVTDDPVAMTIFFARTVRSPTLTVSALSKLARPFSHS